MEPVSVLTRRDLLVIAVETDKIILAALPDGYPAFHAKMTAQLEADINALSDHDAEIENKRILNWLDAPEYQEAQTVSDRFDFEDIQEIPFGL